MQEGGIEPDIAVPQLSDPDYKTRPRFREADLRRHLINEAKLDDSVLEDDAKDDPRFTADRRRSSRSRASRTSSSIMRCETIIAASQSAATVPRRWPRAASGEGSNCLLP